MLPHIPLLLAGALLVAAPGDDETAPGAPLAPDQAMPDQSSPDQGNPLDQLSDAEAFSAMAGTIVGAAAVCNEIGRDRVSAAATKVATIVSTAANNEDEMASARQLFAENA